MLLGCWSLGVQETNTPACSCWSKATFIASFLIPFHSRIITYSFGEIKKMNNNVCFRSQNHLKISLYIIERFGIDRYLYFFFFSADGKNIQCLRKSFGENCNLKKTKKVKFMRSSNDDKFTKVAGFSEKGQKSIIFFLVIVAASFCITTYFCTLNA